MLVYATREATAVVANLPGTVPLCVDVDGTLVKTDPAPEPGANE